jgi:hypothetical protein
MRHVCVRNGILALLATGSLAFSAVLQASAAPASLGADGTIASVGTSFVVIATQTGDHITARATPETRVKTRQPARPEDIVAGEFIAVTAKKEADGALTAVEINILPASLRGKIREGQWPMETGNIMTNAVVTEDVTRVSGRTLSLTYKDGTAMINTPPQAIVHRLTLVTLVDLKAGMRVTARGTTNADGSIAASFIIVDVSGG